MSLRKADRNNLLRSASMTELDKTRDLWASVEDIIAQLHHQMSQMSQMSEDWQVTSVTKKITTCTTSIAKVK